VLACPTFFDSWGYLRSRAEFAASAQQVLLTIAIPADQGGSYPSKTIRAWKRHGMPKETIA
jgi:hypothetical protein